MPPHETAWTARAPAREDIERTRRTFEDQGYVVFERLLPPDLVNDLREAYMQALTAKIARFGLSTVVPPARAHDRFVYEESRPVPTGGNHDINRWNMHLPSRRPFLDPRVFAHPVVLPLVHGLLGEDCLCATLASDTPMPGATYQDVHQDSAGFSLWMNIPLVDVTDEDGPLEIWPGSHRADPLGASPVFSREVNFVRPEGVPGIAGALASRKLALPAGSVVVRDARALHRGTHVRGARPRPMLTIRYEAARTGAYLPVSDALGRIARGVRTISRSHGRVRDPDLLNTGNGLGRMVEAGAATDRTGSRAIPASIWRDLPAPARSLLRFASVDGGDREAARVDRGLGPTVDMLRAFAFVMARDVVASTARRVVEARLRRPA